jgi:hypothetical protein
VVRLLLERVELTRHGETERITVVIHWRGGSVSRHEITQGVRRYTALDRYDELRQRLLRLRGDGLTADRIAEVLHGEGYRVSRGDQFTGHRVRQLLARFGRTGIPPGVRENADLPAGDEYWLPVLAAKLRVKPIIVHRWRWSGWLSARQLRGDHGRWIVRADAAEIKRLARLRAFEIKHHRRRPPTELTTPHQA